MTALRCLLLSLVASSLAFRRTLTRSALPSLKAAKRIPAIDKDSSVADVAAYVGAKLQAKRVPAIDKDSSVADVAAYVGAKLQAKEFAKKLRQFIVDQRIDGGSFLTLTDEELKGCGLNAGGLREELLELVEELAHPQNGKDLHFLCIIAITHHSLCFGNSTSINLGNEIKRT